MGSSCRRISESRPPQSPIAAAQVPSPPRKRGSKSPPTWMPGFAGMTRVTAPEDSRASTRTRWTVSWTPTREGYALRFNRDERRTRGPGLPPGMMEGDGVRFLAPTDADAGGTWIGVNQFGLTVGLLNRYHEAPHDPGE